MMKPVKLSSNTPNTHLRLKQVFILGLCPILLSACAVNQAPQNQSNAMFETAGTYMSSPRSADLSKAQRDINYKFESKNPKFANLGKYDADLNSGLLKTRNALSNRGIREEARSRFAPQVLQSKISNGTSYRDFMKTYGQETQSLNQTSAFGPYDYKNMSFGGQNSDAEIAFVKINGETDTRDWQACAEKSDGVFDTSISGFKLKSSFETCMRMRGYQPEAQAVETLKQAVQNMNNTDMPHASYPSLKGFSNVERSNMTPAGQNTGTDYRSGTDTGVMAGGL